MVTADAVGDETVEEVGECLMTKSKAVSCCLNSFFVIKHTKVSMPLDNKETKLLLFKVFPLLALAKPLG